LVPYISRYDGDGTGSFVSDGFEIVTCGMVEVQEAKLAIFEYDDHIAGQRTPVLYIHFADITRLQARRFKSHGGNFGGGQIRLIVRFDGSQDIQLTFRMPWDHTFALFLDTVKSKIKETSQE